MQIVFQCNHHSIMVDVDVPFDRTPHEVEVTVYNMVHKIIGQWEGNFSSLEDLVGAAMSALPFKWRWSNLSTIVIARRMSY